MTSNFDGKKKPHDRTTKENSKCQFIGKHLRKSLSLLNLLEAMCKQV